MNSLSLLPLPLLALSVACGSLAISALGQDFEKKEFTASGGNSLRYAFLPPQVREKGTRYPLVITLHGVGGRGKPNWVRNCYANMVLAQPEIRKNHPCFVVAPNCAPGETWGSLGRLKGKERIPDLIELIEKLIADLPIDPDRVYVTGQSMGGVGTFAILAERPDLFAAAAPVCGGHLPENGERIHEVPIWVFHGAKDSTVPVDLSRKMVEAIKAAGGKPKYTEYPDVAHNAWTPAYDDPRLWKWLFAQQRNR